MLEDHNSLVGYVFQEVQVASRGYAGFFLRVLSSRGSTTIEIAGRNKLHSLPSLGTISRRLHFFVENIKCSL